jgi:hypothetical protein
MSGIDWIPTPAPVSPIIVVLCPNQPLFAGRINLKLHGDFAFGHTEPENHVEYSISINSRRQR